MAELILIAISAWIGTELACYLALRRVAYSILDPVLVLSVFIAFSGSLLAVLCATNLVEWSKFVLFVIVLLAYLAGARVAGKHFRKVDFREMLAQATSAFTRSEIKAMLVAALLVTLLLATLGVLVGAAGDARQQFGRSFRPLILIHSGLFLVSLTLLLSHRFSTSRAVTWVSVLTLLAIPFSGKGVLVPVLYWVGLRWYVSGRRVNLRIMMISAGVVIVGVGVMAMAAYGKSSLSSVLFLFAYRLWMSGDTYIYAYQLHGLEGLRGQYNVAFIPYMLHPITSLVGIRAYTQPLGAALASQISGQDALTGPNPLLPVLIDFFFPDSRIAGGIAAFAIGYLVIGVRPLGMALQRFRARFLRLGAMVAAIFAPGAGFQDTSQVLISMIAITAVALAGTALDMALCDSPARSASAHLPARP